MRERPGTLIFCQVKGFDLHRDRKKVVARRGAEWLFCLLITKRLSVCTVTYTTNKDNKLKFNLLMKKMESPYPRYSRLCYMNLLKKFTTMKHGLLLFCAATHIFFGEKNCSRVKMFSDIFLYSSGFIEHNDFYSHMNSKDL